MPGTVTMPGTHAPTRPATRRRPVSLQAMRTIRMMHQLEWIAGKFNAAGIPLMALKGAALHPALYDRPGEREMTDLDVLVKPADIGRAQKLLEDLGHDRGEVPFRVDFFPRYYYEIQYQVGSLSPFAIDLHVRPLRPLRFSRVMPGDALWSNAVTVTLGGSTVLVPAPDDMLIHLAAHSAIHGNGHHKWLADIDGWIRVAHEEIDWDRFLDHVESWRLAAAVRSGIEAAANVFGPACPDDVRRRLESLRTNWRDRLALWHAPRDGDHLACSFLVNAVTTPGPRFVMGYLREVILPGRAYLGEWCLRHRCPWPRAAVGLRYLWPLVERVPGLGQWISKVEIRPSAIQGLGVFATRDIAMGEVILAYRCRPVDRTGPLRYVNHACLPTAELRDARLCALVPIRAGQEITMSFGDGVCDCAHSSEKLAADETVDRRGARR